MVIARVFDLTYDERMLLWGIRADNQEKITIHGLCDLLKSPPFNLRRDLADAGIAVDFRTDTVRIADVLAGFGPGSSTGFNTESEL